MLRRPPRRPALRDIARGNAMLAPFPTERHQHGRVELFDEQVADASGSIGRPYRASNTLETMEAAGTISYELRIAGEQFTNDFHLAHLSELKAQDMERALMTDDLAPYREATIGSVIEEARGRVHAKLQSVGGGASDGGSCAWGVLGEQMSLREWADKRTLAGRRTSPEAASGILRAVLAVLASVK